MVATIEDDALALSTTKKWAAEFKRGKEDLEDDSRSGHPASATTQENIDRIYHMVMDNRRLTASIAVWSLPPSDRPNIHLV